MSLFAAAIDDLFDDPHLAQSALYTHSGGDTVAIRVVMRRPDRILEFGDTRIRADTTIIDIRVAEIAKPEPGNTLDLDGEVFIVQGEPVRDHERLIWTLDVRPQ